LVPLAPLAECALGGAGAPSVATARGGLE
jgi:hypothetical protein